VIKVRVSEEDGKRTVTADEQVLEVEEGSDYECWHGLDVTVDMVGDEIVCVSSHGRMVAFEQIS